MTTASHPKLVPELCVSDIDVSSRFYMDKVGCTASMGTWETVLVRIGNSLQSV